MPSSILRVQSTQVNKKNLTEEVLPTTNCKMDQSPCLQKSHYIPLNPFVEETLKREYEEGGSELTAKTSNMQTGSQPIGNS